MCTAGETNVHGFRSWSFESSEDQQLETLANLLANARSHQHGAMLARRSANITRSAMCLRALRCDVSTKHAAQRCRRLQTGIVHAGGEALSSTAEYRHEILYN